MHIYLNKYTNKKQYIFHLNIFFNKLLFNSTFEKIVEEWVRETETMPTNIVYIHKPDL